VHALLQSAAGSASPCPTEGDIIIAIGTYRFSEFVAIDMRMRICVIVMYMLLTGCDCARARERSGGTRRIELSLLISLGFLENLSRIDRYPAPFPTPVSGGDIGSNIFKNSRWQRTPQGCGRAVTHQGARLRCVPLPLLRHGPPLGPPPPPCHLRSLSCPIPPRWQPCLQT